MDCYKDMADIEQAFLTFMDKVPFYGAITACLDDPLLTAVLPRAHRRIFTYGIAAGATYRVRPLEPPLGTFSRFTVSTQAGDLGPFDLHVPGRHNVLNAAAAVAIGHQLEIAPEKIAEGIRGFRGVDRRFHVRGQANGITVVDDYGHHPTEIRATIAAARDCGFRHVHVVFQPHRYSRTQDLLEEFSTAFLGADSVVVLPIYAASEDPIEGVTGELLASKIKGAKVQSARNFGEAVQAALNSAHDGDLILTLGAGNVSQVGPQILDALGGVQLGLGSGAHL
jgi:UDP-N-acetylmuramate--alanine ligase